MTERARDLRLQTLTVEQDGRVLTVRVVAPPYNFMTEQMHRDFDALTRAVDDDETVGAVVVTGGVEKRYITHFDIADILAAARRSERPLSERTLRTMARGVDVLSALPRGQEALEQSPLTGLLGVNRFANLVLRIMRSPAVYIAAIGGPCGGGGLEMSVAFDVRLAADDDAVGFVLPELLIGLTTTVGGQRLAQLIGPDRALEMLLEGRMYSRQEALDMGLIRRLVPPEELLTEAQSLGARYAKRNRDTVAVQKRIFNEDYLLSPAESLRRESAANVAGILSGSAPHAMSAWVDMQQKGTGDSVFLTDLECWVQGDVVDLNASGA
ncbi:enoyl-CoA hydratase/isomerase family protein [Mycolicibacterium sp.]|uniref:enoyl-CoA hydratase/isomerase family protein n=1 Tax=Mycolicibacterium sp. TaxID=2320850 RepID=UPI0037C81ACE